MKPFSLEEYLANPTRKVVTRDGRDVRIVCTDVMSQNFPVVGFVSVTKSVETAMQFTAEGNHQARYDCENLRVDEKS